MQLRSRTAAPPAGTVPVGIVPHPSILASTAAAAPVPPPASAAASAAAPAAAAVVPAESQPLGRNDSAVAILERMPAKLGELMPTLGMHTVCMACPPDSTGDVVIIGNKQEHMIFEHSDLVAVFQRNHEQDKEEDTLQRNKLDQDLANLETEKQTELAKPGMCERKAQELHQVFADFAALHQTIFERKVAALHEERQERDERLLERTRSLAVFLAAPQSEDEEQIERDHVAVTADMPHTGMAWFRERLGLFTHKTLNHLAALGGKLDSVVKKLTRLRGLEPSTVPHRVGGPFLMRPLTPFIIPQRDERQAVLFLAVLLIVFNHYKLTHFQAKTLHVSQEILGGTSQVHAQVDVYTKSALVQFVGVLVTGTDSKTNKRFSYLLLERIPPGTSVDAAFMQKRTPIILDGVGIKMACVVTITVDGCSTAFAGAFFDGVFRVDCVSHRLNLAWHDVHDLVFATVVTDPLHAVKQVFEFYDHFALGWVDFGTGLQRGVVNNEVTQGLLHRALSLGIDVRFMSKITQFRTAFLIVFQSRVFLSTFVTRDTKQFARTDAQLEKDKHFVILLDVVLRLNVSLQRHGLTLAESLVQIMQSLGELLGDSLPVEADLCGGEEGVHIQWTEMKKSKGVTELRDHLVEHLLVRLMQQGAFHARKRKDADKCAPPSVYLSDIEATALFVDRVPLGELQSMAIAEHSSELFSQLTSQLLEQVKTKGPQKVVLLAQQAAQHAIKFGGPRVPSRAQLERELARFVPLRDANQGVDMLDARLVNELDATAPNVLGAIRLVRGISPSNAQLESGFSHLSHYGRLTGDQAQADLTTIRLYSGTHICVNELAQQRWEQVSAKLCAAQAEFKAKVLQGAASEDFNEAAMLQELEGGAVQMGDAVLLKDEDDDDDGDGDDDDGDDAAEPQQPTASKKPTTRATLQQQQDEEEDSGNTSDDEEEDEEDEEPQPEKRVAAPTRTQGQKRTAPTPMKLVAKRGRQVVEESSGEDSTSSEESSEDDEEAEAEEESELEF